MNVYIETFGCQMNQSDTEIVSSLLQSSGYHLLTSPVGADAILLNTCSVRDNAENKIHERINHLKQYKRKKKKLVVGILGCMAERLKEKLLDEKDMVGLVVGPDEYRKLPEILENVLHGEQGIAVKLSRVETYDDIEPLREDGISAFISIMRGCNNFCSYCVVPYTRGRERSRDKRTIIAEVLKLKNRGFREISLLGQNVNSYKDTETGTDFPTLMEELADLTPEIRFRFTTSHPKDISDELIKVMSEYDNICKHLHLPVQSGSSRVLEMMNRGYSAEQYLAKIEKIKALMPNISLSTDIIAGYPGETIEDHQQTLELMRKVRYDGAFMFKYSPREGTKAFDIEDDVTEEEKVRRLNEIIELQQQIAKENNQAEIGRIHTVLTENVSRRSDKEWKGRTDTNKSVVFPIPDDLDIAEGQYYQVKIVSAGPNTLKGELV